MARLVEARHQYSVLARARRVLAGPRIDGAAFTIHDSHSEVQNLNAIVCTLRHDAFAIPLYKPLEIY